MDVQLIEIQREKRNILENLFFYYLYDMSEYMGWNPDPTGKFAYNASILDPFWQQKDHIPYFIYVNNELAVFF